MEDFKASDNESLQRAIQRAIAKEQGTTNPTNPTPDEPERMWILRTPVPFIKPFRTRDPRAMQLYCDFLHTRYPKCPLHIFSFEIPTIQKVQQVYKVR
jgi:hypothetical protein